MASMTTGAVSATSGGWGATLDIPEGCSSLALNATDGDCYMTTAASPADASAWILLTNIPEVIEERLLAGQTIKFKGVSGAVDVRYRAILAERA